MQQNDLDKAYQYLSAFCGTLPLPMHLVTPNHIDAASNSFLNMYSNEKEACALQFGSIQH